MIKGKGKTVLVVVGLILAAIGLSNFISHMGRKEMGVIPENAKLAPMPEDIKEWEALSDEERELFAIQMYSLWLQS